VINICQKEHHQKDEEVERKTTFDAADAGITLTMHSTKNVRTAVFLLQECVPITGRTRNTERES